jgi:hypothetical protein
MISTLGWDGEVRWPVFWSCLTRSEERRTGVEGPRERSLRASAREDSKPTIIAYAQGMRLWGLRGDGRWRGRLLTPG